MRTHPPNEPQTVPDYKEEIAEEYEVDEGDVPLWPAMWREHQDKFE